MARIGIDARKYFDFGIGRYIQNLIRMLGTLPNDHEFIAFTPRTTSRRITLPSGWSEHPVRHGTYSLSEWFLLGTEVRRRGCDVFHEPHYTLPLGLRNRAIVTIHDLIHVRFPQYYGGAARAYASFLIRHAVRNAGAIITDSEFTRQDLMDFTGVSGDRVHALHCGIDPDFRVLSRDTVDEFKDRCGLNGVYILYVGNVKPHKNVAALLTAARIVTSEMPELKIVFAGASPYEDRSLAPLLRDKALSDKIVVLGGISQEDLVAAYNGAAVTVLPSFYEGFGFSAVEAMACGCPVVASKAGSLPEVVADAGVMVEPTDDVGMADGIRSILMDSHLRHRLIASGFENVKRFSWRQNAERTLQLYEQLL